MPTLEDLLAAQDADSWSPNRDETADHDKILTGTLIAVETFSGDFGDSPIAVLDRGEDVDPDKFSPAGRFVKWFVFGSVAQGEWDEKKPQIGERIGVIYKGTGLVKAGANKGKPYAIYGLLVEREGPPPAAPAPMSDIPTDVKATEIDGIGPSEPEPARSVPADDDIPF